MSFSSNGREEDGNGDFQNSPRTLDLEAEEAIGRLETSGILQISSDSFSPSRVSSSSLGTHLASLLFVSSMSLLPELCSEFSPCPCS